MQAIVADQQGGRDLPGAPGQDQIEGETRFARSRWPADQDGAIWASTVTPMSGVSPCSTSSSWTSSPRLARRAVVSGGVGGARQDESGNGGGYVFDGRDLPNPGREERFKSLTGRDAPVIDYLNQQESVHQFLASVMLLVDASVHSYQRRGFKHLMVSFGCTGGQHRSVYLAEQVAKRLRERNAVEVILQHRELERMESERVALGAAAPEKSQP